MSLHTLVTGTSRGIGLELTHQMAQAGHYVWALARAPEKSPGLLKLKENYGKQIQTFAVDVNSEAQVASFVKALSSSTSPSIDLLVNNAGVYGEDADFAHLSFETLLKTIETNAIGPMRLTRALLPNLNQSKNPKVIHITSLMGSIGDNHGGGHYAYRMSKAALNMFNKSFSIDYPKITSLVIHPGWVKTEMGGPDAPIEAQTSARGILEIAKTATLAHSGKFLDYEGDEMPW